MKHKSYMTIQNFSKNSHELRNYFDEQFADSHRTHQKRFVWDHWSANGQYKHHRTPAYHYFPKGLYREFHEGLLKFGREVLGCYDVTPPWLSYYTDGDYQKVHGDIPHGPWAFVYSLTKCKPKKFSGGETFLFKEDILNYWSSFEHFQGLESRDVLHEIQPHFNQLLVFDPRIPHGVNTVKGVDEPSEGRIVIHGWFKDPEPYVVGPLTRKQAAQATGDLLGEIGRMVGPYSVMHGTQSFRIKISPKGNTLQVQALTDTLRFYDPTHRKSFDKILNHLIKSFRFPKSRGVNWLTLPIVYRF